MYGSSNPVNTIEADPKIWFDNILTFCLLIYLFKGPPLDSALNITRSFIMKKMLNDSIYVKTAKVESLRDVDTVCTTTVPSENELFKNAGVRVIYLTSADIDSAKNTVREQNLATGEELEHPYCCLDGYAFIDALGGLVNER